MHALELEVVTDAQANVMAVAALVAQKAIVPDKRKNVIQFNLCTRKCEGTNVKCEVRTTYL